MRHKNRQAMQFFKVSAIFFIFSSFFSLRKNAMPACFDHRTEYPNKAESRVINSVGHRPTGVRPREAEALKGRNPDLALSELLTRPVMTDVRVNLCNSRSKKSNN
jgi:hypothetical protein